LSVLLIEYFFGVRSERRLCEEAHLNPAYRWFCRLGFVGAVHDHSTLSKRRHVSLCRIAATATRGLRMVE
jgi:transposase